MATEAGREGMQVRVQEHWERSGGFVLEARVSLL